MPASRTRNWTSVVVRSRIVNETGSMSYLKKMPGDGKKSCQFREDISVADKKRCLAHRGRRGHALWCDPSLSQSTGACGALVSTRLRRWLTPR